MPIITKKLRECGEPVVFYQLDENKNPVADPKKIGLLSLCLMMPEEKREVKIYYHGKLNMIRLNELVLGSELERSVDELITSNQNNRRGVAHLEGGPIILLDFNDEYLNSSSVILLKSKKRTKHPFSIDIMGNIELKGLSDFMYNSNIPLSYREQIVSEALRLEDYVHSQRR